VLGGTPVFRGTRVPFQALLDYLEGGQTLDDFLDECVPRKLKNSFPGHECQTVPEAGFAGKKNGELLYLADRAGFEVFVTVEPWS